MVNLQMILMSYIITLASGDLVLTIGEYCNGGSLVARNFSESTSAVNYITHEECE